MATITPPDPAPFAYDELRGRDEVAQGRALFLVLVLAYALLWGLDFVSKDVLLVPAFLFDRSAAVILAMKVGILLLAAVFVLLTWSGMGWARYAFALYLLLCGMLQVILSIQLGAEWGLGPLLLGAVEVGGAAALVMSISLLRFVEAQRRRPFPWIAAALTMIGTVTLLLVVTGVDFVLLQESLAKNRAETQLINRMMTRFAPDLNPATLDDWANDEFRRKMEGNNFADFRTLLGDYQSVDLYEGLSWNEILHPRPASNRPYNYYTMAHYTKADAQIVVEVTGRGNDLHVDDLYATEVGHRLAPRPPLPAKSQGPAARQTLNVAH